MGYPTASQLSFPRRRESSLNPTSCEQQVAHVTGYRESKREPSPQSNDNPGCAISNEPLHHDLSPRTGKNVLTGFHKINHEGVILFRQKELPVDFKHSREFFRLARSFESVCLSPWERHCKQTLCAPKVLVEYLSLSGMILSTPTFYVAPAVLVIARMRVPVGVIARNEKIDAGRRPANTTNEPKILTVTDRNCVRGTFRVDLHSLSFA